MISANKYNIIIYLKNTGERDYRSKQAQNLAITREANNPQTITHCGWCYFETLLARQYSPEQITGRLLYRGWEVDITA